MAHDVFISYASEDRTAANAVCATLEARKIRCWVAPRDVTPGRNYAAEIVRGISGGSLLVLVHSSRANSSKYVMREIERAVDRDIPILPLRIEDVPPSEDLELFISAVQWFDAFPPPLEPHLQSFADQVERLLSRTAPPGPGTVPAPGAGEAESRGDVVQGAKVRAESATAWPGGETVGVEPGGLPRSSPRSPTPEHLMGEIRCFEGHTDGVYGVAFSPDGRRIASWSADATVRVWDTVSGSNQLLISDIHYISCVAFSPDGRRIRVASTPFAGYEVQIWDSDSSRAPVTLVGHTFIVHSVIFSFDGRRVASVSQDRTVRIWDADSSRSLLKLTGHKSSIKCVAFSPDGRRVASGSCDKTIRIWDVDSRRFPTGLFGRELVKLTGHGDSVESVAFSPDGRHIASGSDDKTVRIWDSCSDDSLGVLDGHNGAVESVAFSPDGRRIASGSRDKTVRVWDAVSGRVQAVFTGHGDLVLSVAFSPDGRCVLSGSLDKTMRLWKLPD